VNEAHSRIQDLWEREFFFFFEPSQRKAKESGMRLP